VTEPWVTKDRLFKIQGIETIEVMWLHEV
jgi:hypothetical protein